MNLEEIILDFLDLIKDKKLCEIHMENDNEHFDVGIIFHANEDSVFVKWIDKKGNFNYYLKLPVDYVTQIKYDTEYLSKINVVYDELLDDEILNCAWKDDLEFFEYAKENDVFLVIEGYNGDAIANGTVLDYNDSQVKLASYDEVYKERNGYSIVNTQRFYTVRFGGEIKLV